ncbi:MAG: galactokinase [Oscillospiraceae bacterium]|nr:galactokinase [Oscillospiraceae bacterium]
MLSVTLKENILNNKYNDVFVKIYGGNDTEKQRDRYVKAITEFEKIYGENRDIAVYSAPGRTEICGNHTDHNFGLIVAAAISEDTICVAAKNEENLVKIASEGYDEMQPVNLEKLRATVSDEGTTRGLVKGICAGVKKWGGECRGLDLYITSDVLKGSGLSSSAAFENAVAVTINSEYNNDKFTAVELALIAQYAENEYFAKPCGVMDQTVSAVGGTICLDLEDVKNPKVTQLPLELDKMGLTLFNVDSKASHDDLTEEYTSMPKEMKDIAQLFMKDGLRRLDMETYINHVSFLRDMFGDRAVLRGMHFFMECKRVEDLCKAVQTNDKELFLKKITESGHSSYEYLQNAYVASNPRVQPMAVALSVAQSFLQDKGGAWRLQGGGFAGAIQCFVPDDIADSFVKYMEIVLGEGCCKAVKLRSCGAVKVLG